MIRIVSRYTREQIRSNPSTLYVFGDNCQRSGFGGQAREARGEPNAIGIVTKNSPSNLAHAFFSDEDFTRVKPMVQDAFRRLHQHLKKGGDIAYPADGVGTGLANLSEKAPLIFAFIIRCEKHLGISK